MAHRTRYFFVTQESLYITQTTIISSFLKLCFLTNFPFKVFEIVSFSLYDSALSSLVSFVDFYVCVSHQVTKFWARGHTNSFSRSRNTAAAIMMVLEKSLLLPPMLGIINSVGGFIWQHLIGFAFSATCLDLKWLGPSWNTVVPTIPWNRTACSCSYENYCWRWL